MYINTNMKKKTPVYGIGINDSTTNMTVGGIRLLSYRTWHNMIRRCYDVKTKSTKPSYSNCTVCGDWLNYNSFREWFDLNYIGGYCLDKDVMYPGNEEYSPDYCIFIPNHINVLLTDRSRGRGEYPLGVSKESRRNKYKACISVLGKNKHLGFYDTPEEAHEAWRVAKKKYVSECANESFSKGEISERVRDALLYRNF